MFFIHNPSTLLASISKEEMWMSYHDGLEKYHFLSCNNNLRHGIRFEKIPSQPWRKLVLENRVDQKGFLLVWGGFLGFIFGWGFFQVLLFVGVFIIFFFFWGVGFGMGGGVESGAVSVLESATFSLMLEELRPGFKFVSL